MKKIFILDDKDLRNYFETMGIISKSEEGAVIFVRFFDCKENCVDKIFSRKRTIRGVLTLVLELLQTLDLIKDQSNWEYSIDHSVLYEQQDFFKKDFGKESAVYFAFKLKKSILLNL